MPETAPLGANQHPHEMPEATQVTPLHSKDQRIYFVVLLDFQIPQPVTESPVPL